MINWSFEASWLWSLLPISLEKIRYSKTFRVNSLHIVLQIGSHIFIHIKQTKAQKYRSFTKQATNQKANQKIKETTDFLQSTTQERLRRIK